MKISKNHIRQILCYFSVLICVGSIYSLALSPPNILYLNTTCYKKLCLDLDLLNEDNNCIFIPNLDSEIIGVLNEDIINADDFRLLGIDTQTEIDSIYNECVQHNKTAEEALRGSTIGNPGFLTMASFGFTLLKYVSICIFIILIILISYYLVIKYGKRGHKDK